MLWLLLLSQAAWAERVLWQPEKTRAVIVGVLSWQDTGITTFASQDRKDLELYQTLLRRGVPAQNMALLLDKQATHQAILEALSSQLAASSPGETFLFYYAGHGVLRDGRVMFVPYDFGSAPGLGMQEIGSMLDENVRSDRTLLFADCCYSGGLQAVADRLQADGHPAASLTSATATQPSVSHWTFTEILIDCLNGAPAADRNGDLLVTLEETAVEVADAMRFHENQQDGVTPRSWFDDLVLSPAEPIDKTLVPPYHRFDYVEISQGQNWEIGRLTGYRDGAFTVELQGYSERTQVQVDAEHILPVPSPPTIVLSPEQALQSASVDGKYSDLLRVLEAEPDYLQYGSFNEYGYHQACSYRGYGPLPEGYWVYVYPSWYLWKSMARGGTPESGPVGRPEGPSQHARAAGCLDARGSPRCHQCHPNLSSRRSTDGVDKAARDRTTRANDHFITF
jgi:hypothetical protein